MAAQGRRKRQGLHPRVHRHHRAQPRRRAMYRDDGELEPHGTGGAASALLYRVGVVGSNRSFGCGGQPLGRGRVSTGAWPRSFSATNWGTATLQDPKLAAGGGGSRAQGGGLDRLLVPARGCRRSSRPARDGIRGDAHTSTSECREAARRLPGLRPARRSRSHGPGWKLAGAGDGAVDDSECFLLWAVPTWQEGGPWGEGTAEPPGAGRAGAQNPAWTEHIGRILVEAALSPMRLGRQPSPIAPRPGRLKRCWQRASSLATSNGDVIATFSSCPMAAVPGSSTCPLRS